MSDLKISELTPQTSATTGDLLVAARGSTNYHITWDNFKTSLGKQDTLVSGTNIKTVNSTSLLGSGDIAITPNAAHTGDVTGATALTIANGAVTLAKMANMATASLIYRKTAGTGAPEVNTLATLKTDLGLTGTNSGDVTLAGTPNYLTIVGQVITRVLINLASHVTGILPVANGGTGQTTYTNGQLLIGNTTGNTLTKATLTAGAGISITNGAGAITIAATGGGVGNADYLVVAKSPGQTTNAGSATKINYSDALSGGIDRGANWDNSLSRFVAPVSGFYVGATSVYCNAGGSSTFVMYVTTNSAPSGIVAIGSEFPTNAGPLADSISIGIWLNAGDYIEVFCFTSVARTLVADYTRFTLTLVAT
jgi:hypothetical protein